MQLVAENIINELIKAKTQLPSIKHSASGAGIMRLHDKDSMEDLVDRNINMLTCVNDRA